MTDKNQYPDLPQKYLDALLDHIYEHGTTSEGVLKRVESMLHSYADATCALRAGKPSAFQGKVTRYSDQSVLVTFPSCHLASEFERSLSATQPGMQHATFGHATQPQEAAPSQEAEDTARLDWLEQLADGFTFPNVCSVVGVHGSWFYKPVGGHQIERKSLREIIDAARAQQEGER